MTFAINVEGGTGAGRKRPLRDKPDFWECACSPSDRTIASAARVGYTNGRRVQPGYLVRCPVCKQERQ